MRTRDLGLVLCVLLAAGAGAQGLMYVETFNSDPGPGVGGWSDLGTPEGMQWLANGGPDDSGHIFAMRGDKYPPYMAAFNDPVKSAIGGDVAAKFGPVFTISLDAKLDDAAPPDEIGYGWWLVPTAGGIWYNNILPRLTIPAGWRHHALTLDANWTDAQANANGWYRWSGTSSWYNAIRGVGYWNFNGRALNFSGGGPYNGHLDNVVFTPEPASVGLLMLGAGSVLLLRRRRRA